MITGNRIRRSAHGITNLGLGGAITVAGVLGFGTAAYAHANIVSGVVTCASPLGSGYQVAWTVSNDWNLSETAQVVSVTGGVASLSAFSLAIPASGNGAGGKGSLPYASTTLRQSLPGSASGAIVIDVSSVYADHFTTTNAGEVNLPTSCSPPAAMTPAVTTTTIPAVVTTTTVVAPPAAVPQVPSTTVPNTDTALPQVPSTTVPNIDVETSAASNPLQPAELAVRGESTAKRPLRPTLLANEITVAKPAKPIVEQAALTG
jgi:hypothetical protein